MCRQAQDKLSDVAAQAQVKAQELKRDVSFVHIVLSACVTAFSIQNNGDT